MARSISRAAYDNGMAVTIVMQEEARAADDRQLALRLAGRRVPPRPAQARPGRVELDDEALERFTRLSLDGHGESQAHDPWSPLLGNPEGESSKSARSSMIMSGQTARTECASCRDSKLSFEVTEMPCKHSYCRECVTRLFEDSITDESLFPPRCCREAIPLSRVRDLLESELTARFESKSIEFNDPLRTYCAVPSCS